MRLAANGLKLAILFCALTLGSRASAQDACVEDEVLLRGDWGQARFSIEVADDPDERARGLMFRESMPQGDGMLFIFEQTQRVAFWMRNTLIELDMLFITEDGVVYRVHDRAIPHDETPIPGGAPVLAVLEINGGLAQMMGIDAGTEVRHPAFGPDAAWPCLIVLEGSDG